jgi:hypothetical protein
MAPDDPEDPTVKDLLAGRPLDEVVDDATRRELEKWFALPSFSELEAKGAELPDDPELAAARERRAKAIEAVDPALLETIRVRYEDNTESLIRFEAKLDVHVDPDLALLDLAMLERVHTVADPREVERPEVIGDDLKDVTPQALLRDLHRPETDFTKELEIVDFAAQQRFDIVAEVEQVMKTSWKLPPLGRSPFVECRELVDEVRRERRRSWPALIRELKLPNRRVQE